METFSLVTTKDAFWVVIVLVAHFDMEHLQMDVKTVFLSRDLDEDIYIARPAGFVEKDKEYTYAG